MKLGSKIEHLKINFFKLKKDSNISKLNFLLRIFNF